MAQSQHPPQMHQPSPTSAGQPRLQGTLPLSPHESPKDLNVNRSSIPSPNKQPLMERSCPTPLPHASEPTAQQQTQDTNVPLQGEKVPSSAKPPQDTIDHSASPIVSDKPPETNTTIITQQTPIAPTCPIAAKKSGGHKIGPKSKTMAAKQYSQLEDLDHYKCTITVQENGTLNGYVSQGSVSSAGGHQSCDSSDSEVASEDTPIFTLLKPVKRKRRNAGRDGIFVGPKRIKLAKQVRERQERRQRHLQEQIRQNELEEQLIAQRAELATEQNGPLANILLQSSILLADSKVEESDSVEECIANIKAERNAGGLSAEGTAEGDSDKSSGFASCGNGSGVLMGNKKQGRRSQNKVFHNENSVIIKEMVSPVPLRKLRAKDFKWSHYIKSMRYWCHDCAQGFKNQKEANSHSEDRCKWNCLYMLECYVVVKDIQTHPVYGSKVGNELDSLTFIKGI